MRTVTFQEVSIMAMTSGGERRINKVIHEGRLMHWVGIGWVEVREATEADRNEYPAVVSKKGKTP